MSTDKNAPKIFISYSWKPIQNKLKVTKLAERMTSDGIHVILDDWDLKEGQDKYSFMEQMVNNPEVKRVLLICNKDYSEKANSKKGGVGIESLIVSDEIYSKVDQTKFIPIVFEYDSDGKPFVPTFVKTRIFIDLSNEDIFEDNYEKLLRNIFDKPSSRRPPIGTIPSYLNSEEPIFLLTAHKVLTIKNSLINEKKNTPLLIQDYLDTFILAIKSFMLNETELDANNFAEKVTKSIDEIIVLRNDFIDFIETITTYSLTMDIERLHNFFEKLLEFISSNDFYSYSTNTLTHLKNDNLRFFYYELFLTFCTLMIERERFEELGHILQTPYVIEIKDRREVKELTFTEFRQHVATLNEHINLKHNPKRVSVTADTIKQRATEKITFEKLRETDILLYYISLLYPSKDEYFYPWFPETSCYNSYGVTTLPKIKSQRYFDKIKFLFGVKNKEELILKVNEINTKNLDNIQRGYYNIPKISNGLRVSEIGSIS